MSHSTTTSHRWQILLGVALTAVLALGAALLAHDGPRALAPTQGLAATPSGTPPDCPALGLVVAAAVTATTPGASSASVSSAQGRATSAARATTSDDVRELAQNLADDLAAYRATVTTPSATSAQRHTDIGASISGDLTALRHICGH
ncbi:hypothetical protein GCM10009817_24610 [Terrabacter lapilli]|uniref:Uncharacterized protein n=1 Tax=Terrabacter lapilli TaxID=436231 RepID=A0ABN2S8S5_9MICO